MDRLAGTSVAPPARKNSRHSSRPPGVRPSRWVVSVRTASVLTTAPRQPEKNSVNRRWWGWLRSRRETRAPVSRRSSPAMLERFQDVGAMVLGQVRSSRLQSTQQVLDTGRRRAVVRGGKLEKAIEGQADDVRPLAP